MKNDTPKGVQEIWGEIFGRRKIPQTEAEVIKQAIKGLVKAEEEGRTISAGRSVWSSVPSE